jgi:hypothetical protein
VGEHDAGSRAVALDVEAERFVGQGPEP